MVDCVRDYGWKLSVMENRTESSIYVCQKSGKNTRSASKVTYWYFTRSEGGKGGGGGEGE